MTAKRKCVQCTTYGYEHIRINGRSYCDFDCVAKYALEKSAKDREKAAKKLVKIANQKHTKDKQRIKKTTDWYKDLAAVVHYYVKHILRKGEPCYTCDKPRPYGKADKSQSFHVGHYMPAKQIDPRRFMLENLRIQCYACNKPLSGNQAVYRKRLIDEMGLAHVEWLECSVNHKELKEVFPHYEDIKLEIARYRKLNKELPVP